MVRHSITEPHQLGCHHGLTAAVFLFDNQEISFKELQQPSFLLVGLVEGGAENGQVVISSESSIR